MLIVINSLYLRSGRAAPNEPNEWDRPSGPTKSRRQRNENQIVRAEGLEPSRSSEHRYLKPACMPIPPRPRVENRTAAAIERVGGPGRNGANRLPADGGAERALFVEFDGIQPKIQSFAR